MVDKRDTDSAVKSAAISVGSMAERRDAKQVGAMVVALAVD